MKTHKRGQRSLLLSAVLVLTADATDLNAQEFRISEATVNPQGQFIVRFPSSADYYYILRRGDAPQAITSPRAAALGTGGAGQLADPAGLANTGAAFFRVLQVPRAQPLDLDADALDDVYELLRPAFLHPLDPTDAARDYDGDGRSNLQEYLGQTNPADLPPDPGTTAPPLSPTGTGGLGEATAFLYTGPNAIQTGVSTSVFDPKRITVLRGKVSERNGASLPGVKVTVLNRPEYGQTRTRADGMFDLAVNGGSPLTVKYERPGYCPIQRQVSVPWNDYVCLPDAVMVTMDPLVTPVAMGTNSPAQVAQASVQSDADGTRRATLLFPAGTCANIVVNGQTQSCTSLSVRATEFTVGANGPAAMPAVLPPSSLYTYCLELSADEAEAAGASSVEFTQPLCLYLENFLNFPVGQAVPMGYYDREKGVWVASRNGRVIKVLSETGGLAVLDTDGDANPDSPAQLTALGITDDERQRLAQLYSPGQTLWRTCVTHFTPWDCNWPGGPPPDAKPPPPPPDDKPLDNPCLAGGSVIGIENQALGESVPIVGTPFRLQYQSDRVFGNRSAYTIRIPLSEATVPPGLKRIVLTVEVAGRAFTHEFPPNPNQELSFTWDGFDAYGRFVPGTQPVKVRTGYVYEAFYYEPAEFDQAFAAFSDSVITANSAREEVTLWRHWNSTVGTWLTQAVGLGGWTLDVLHAYDANSKTLYLGDGGRRSASAFDLTVISTFAGGGSAPGASIGDGGPATGAEVFVPSGLAVGPDGSVYIAEQNGQRVRRVTPDGLISTIAGSTNGQPCTNPTNACGDGGLATQAFLNVPHGVAVAADGTIYIADRGSSRVRKVDPSGIITTVAGTGQWGFSGDGGPATLAQLNSPFGVAIGPDGLLYIADTGNQRIRRVGAEGIITTVAGGGIVPGPGIGEGGPATKAELSQPWRVAFDFDGRMYIVDRGNRLIRRVGTDGLITTVAGSGFPDGFLGDGGPAVLAKFGQPEDIAITPDGGFYIADPRNARIRFVGPEGIITTFAGTGRFGRSGDGGPATQAELSEPIGLALAPDGTLYEADWFNQRVRKIRSALPGFSVNDSVIPSEDGHEVYIFDNSGRHLRTLDAFTRAVRYEFSYDSQHGLSGVTDGDGNLTAIERDPNGSPTAVISPYGQRTELVVSALGDLVSIRNPAGESTTLAYNSGGLLALMTDPRTNVWTFEYDSLGRLTRDADPAGGYQLLTRAETTNGPVVAISTALARTNRIEVSDLPTGGHKRLYTYPTGLQAEYEEHTSGVRTSRLPDGSLTVVVLGPDPRWGMLAPVVTTNITITPGGLTNLMTSGRSTTLSNDLDILSVRSWRETNAVNGRAYVNAYDAATRTQTNTTPAGRKLVAIYDRFMRPLREEILGLQPTFYRYDARGRMDQIVRGSGAQARTNVFTYDAGGFVAGATDQLGRSVSLGYDSAGRIISQTWLDQRNVGFSYDRSGNLAGVTPPGRAAHSFAYSPVNLESRFSPPELIPGTNDTHLIHNADRELTLVWRPDGETVRFDYSGDGCNCARLNSVVHARGTNFFAYDPLTGNLASIRAADGTLLTHTYDGPLLLSETWSGPVNGSVGVTYDSSFRPATQSVNGADAIVFGYDPDSLLIRAGTLTLTNDPQTGLLIGGTLDSIADRWSYNGFAEPVSHVATTNGAPVYTAQYTRDAIGRIEAVTESISGVTNSFGYHYDLAGHLTNVTQNGVSVATYTYDSNNDRLSTSGSAGTRAGTCDAQDRLTQYGATTYTYTPNGELRTRHLPGQTTTFEYDAFGNLVSVTLPNATQIQYLVDGRNRRVGKRVNGVLVQGFLYDGLLDCVAELDGAGNVVSRFVYGERAGVPEYMVKAGVTYRFITDHRGSVRLVVNAANGQIAQRIDYDEFGQVLADTAPGFQPFGFAGGLYDRDTGLVRFGARDYDAETGRWTAKDPILFQGRQANLYAYVNNDPVNRRDPEGLQSLPDFDQQKKKDKDDGGGGKEPKCPPKRDAMKEYQKTRQEFAGEKSAAAAQQNKSRLQQVADTISSALGF